MAKKSLRDGTLYDLSSFNKKIATNLMLKRQEVAGNRASLARISGISENRIAAIERGGAMTVREWEILSIALGLSALPPTLLKPRYEDPIKAGTAYEALDFDEKIAHNIRRRREDLKMSIKRLAEKTKIHKHQIYRTEKGDRKITLEEMEIISIALECDPLPVNALKPMYEVAK